MKRLFLAAMIIAVLPAAALAHAFLDHASPAVGSQVDRSIAEVKIWFTEEIEPAFSAIRVFDATGKQVDRQDSHVDAGDQTLLIVSLPALAAGQYKVVWQVVASDTHKTHGDFKFTVKP
jgi:methionine-rich copper-binding protein CopC